MFKSIFYFAVLLFFVSCQSTQKTTRNQDFNFGWKFSLKNDSTSNLVNFDDKDWETINLPHDWSVDFPFDTIHGEGCTGYLPGGIGWYRKHFDVEIGKEITILFDGVYNHAEVWINGHELGYHPYGYTPFHYNLTPYITPDGKNNVIAVKVDHSRYADSRWYTGSGIYRNVKLITTNKLHVPVWGTFVSTPTVSKDQATVQIKTKIKNDYHTDKSIVLVTKIIGPDGQQIAEKQSSPVSVDQGMEKEITQQLEVTNPQLWGVDTPVLYQAISQVIEDGKTVDQYETSFGIRTIHFDADKGFFLNGKNMKIKGVCLHHDGGLVGSAVPDGVWERRLQILKNAGCNAIRTSHNPPSQAFLDLCDKMGFLVQNEFFDEWDYPKDKRLNGAEQHDDYISRGSYTYFQKWAEKDLQSAVLAHRNHPSVFEWSIGNEIEWTYPRNKQASGFWNANWTGNYFWNPTPLTPSQIKERYEKLPALEHNIGETAQQLSKWTKELDTTRPVIANCILPSVSYVSGYADALDVIGFSYRRVMYDYGHKYFPNKPIMGTENVAQWHEWKAIEERPFIAGTFLWTGIDYMGEANFNKDNPNARHQRGIDCGLLDLAGFKKPSYFMMKSLWSNSPTLHINTQVLSKSIYKIDPKTGKLLSTKPWEHALWSWQKVNDHWNYANGDPIVVEVLSNCPEVELFLNGKSLGTKKLADFEDHIYKWLVPFSPGTLTAKGSFNGDAVEDQLATAEEPATIKATIDKNELKANGYDVANIVVQLVDKNGHPVKTQNRTIHFDVSGDVKVLGVDNGSLYNLQKYQTDSVLTNDGRALLVLQSLPLQGQATLVATSSELKSNPINIQIK